MGQEPPTPQSEIVPRIGTYMLLLGIFAIIFFLASDFAEQPEFDWLFVGMILLGIGVVLRRRAPPVPPSGRFGTLRKFREDAIKRREERKKKASKR